MAPCCDCGTTKRERSACPLCGKVFCQRCAEKPYAFCCPGDVDDGEPMLEMDTGHSGGDR